MGCRGDAHGPCIILLWCVNSIALRLCLIYIYIGLVWGLYGTSVWFSWDAYLDYGRFFNRNSTELWMGSSIGSLCDVVRFSYAVFFEALGAAQKLISFI